MNSKDFLALSQRDAKVVGALSSGLKIMKVLNGSTTEISGRLVSLQLEEHMLQFHEALLLLGVDSNEIP